VGKENSVLVLSRKALRSSRKSRTHYFTVWIKQFGACWSFYYN